MEVTDSLLTRYLSVCLKNVCTTLPASNCENVYSCSCLLVRSCCCSPAAIKTVHPVYPTVAASVISSEVLTVLVSYLWDWRCSVHEVGILLHMPL